MQRLIILALALCFTSASTQASTTEPNDNKGTTETKGARPDLPGKLLINIGSSYFVNPPDGMKTKWLGSRPLDIYYTYPVDIESLKLSIVPGLGFGFDRFSFQKSVVLAYQAEGNVQNLVLDSIENVTALRSKLIINYVDLPVEIRFVPKIEAKEKSFFVGVGGSVGYLFEAHTKFKYEEDGSKEMTKQREDWNLNKIRYSVHARIGVGGFSVYYKMGLSNVFQTGKGPNGFDLTSNTIGISFNGF